MGRDPYSASIESHYAKHWGAPIGRHRLTVGPVHQLPPGFEILVFKRLDALCYSTACMSLPADDARIELHLLADAARGFQPELIELMTFVAHYHRTGARLGVGHSVNFGRPWVEGATSSFGLISLPYLDGPALEWLDKPRIRFLWLVPITERERDFKMQHGTESLEQRFEAACLNYVNPTRDSVV